MLIFLVCVSIVNFLFKFKTMVADSRHREKTFKIEKNFHNREKTVIIEKKLSESRKKFWNPEKYFRIEKTISKSSKMFQNREIFCY